MKKLLPLFVLSTASLFAQEDLPPGRDQGFSQTLIMIAIAMLFFYFILLRPEQKRRKQMDDLRTGLRKGDRVVAMGIVGTVDRINENTVILKSYEGAKFEVLKQAITDVQPASEEEVRKNESNG